MRLDIPPVLPMVDFSAATLKPGTSTWLSATTEVQHALEEYGCFLAVYDQVSTELHRDVYSASREVLDLPLEKKLQNVSDKPYYGYVGQIPIIPLHEGMGMGDATTVEGIESFTKIMFPNGNKHFSETMISFAKTLSKLEQMVKMMVCQSYGVGNLYDSLLESTTYLLRINKYRLPQKEETNIGAKCHTDKSFITILSQNHINGLEVRTKDGEWVAVKFPPSSFLVMAGDALLAWSNGRVHSAFHRVIISGEEERYSTGFFSFDNGTLQVPEELVDDENPRIYKAFNHFGLLNYFAENMEKHISDCSAAGYCGV